ncbi:glutathione peroxidase [Phenylobacterium montanum]|uniref:Glutathione peroxidase n=1 Tax=Phenylobacterium montanum TaxID=2823693 RepID=A0A975G256_9CAUL|nr:glutathione peroxidase [Caulobacter sp. S6]QUD89214.1 glutathione peroxidase [Caulobacter sp. S6]
MAASLQEISVNHIDGSPGSLGEFAGKVVLVVNVASKCGLTPQYEGLEKLYEAYRGRGLVVAGFPANEFAGQEPGSNAEIAAFCETSFGVTFPMFEKIVVKGEGQHPLYKALTAAVTEAVGAPDNAPKTGEVSWNFEKFLVNRQGAVVGRFSPVVKPDDPRLVAAIEAQLDG